MYDRVLLALDSSPRSWAALSHAARVAGPDGRVTVVSVVPTRAMVEVELAGSAYEFATPGVQSLGDLCESVCWDRRHAAEALLHVAREELERRGVQAVETEVCEGLAGEAIVDALLDHESDAVVMGTRGHGGAGPEVLGSVAQYVLRHAGHAAVVLVGPQAASTSQAHGSEDGRQAGE